MLPDSCCQPLKLARLDYPSYAACWLCVDAELAIGQCRLGCMEPVVWTTLSITCGRCHNWVGIPGSTSLCDPLWVSRTKEKTMTYYERPNVQKICIIYTTNKIIDTRKWRIMKLTATVACNDKLNVRGQINWNHRIILKVKKHFFNIVACLILCRVSDKTWMLAGVYTSNLLNDFDFYLGQILSLYEAKYLGQIFSQTFCFIEGQYLAQIKFQIV